METIYQKIIGLASNAAGRIAELSAKLDATRRDIKLWQDRQQRALVDGDGDGYVQAGRMLSDLNLQEEFAQKVLSSAGKAAVTEAEAAGLHAELLRAIKEEYKGKAREMIPLLEDLEKKSAEAEALLARYHDLCGRINILLNRNHAFPGIYDNRIACFTERIKSRREAMEKML